MSLIDFFRGALYEPSVRDVPVDDSSLLSLHRSLLKQKPMLHSAFLYFYQKMLSLNVKYLNVDGIELELGSGAGFFKEINPVLLTSDIRSSGDFDISLDAQEMDIEDGTIRCIYAINVFHHLSDPRLFFNELNRVLVPGGGCIIIESYVGIAS